MKLNCNSPLARQVSLACTILFVAYSAAPCASATTYTWIKNTVATQDWADTTNWAAGTTFVSGSANELAFFPDTITALINGNNVITTNVPAALAMNAFSLNGKGAAATGASNITIGTAASTWTIGDGTTSIVNLTGINGTQALSYTTAANFTLNQAVTTFIGNGTASFIFSGIIGETALGNGITKSGSSTFTLSGGNTFSGPLAIKGGTLSIGTINNASVNGPLGNSTTSVTLGDTGGATGSLFYTGATATSTKSFTLASGGIGIFNIPTLATNITLSSVIDGAGSFVKSGIGTQTLSGINTYSGTTTVNTGILAPTLATALSGYITSGRIIFNGGAITTKLGDGTTTGWSTAQVDALLSNATKISGQLGIDTNTGGVTQWTPFTISNFGALGLLKAGANTLTLSSANNYTGTTSVNGGTILLSGSGTLGDAANTLSFGGTSSVNLGGSSQTLGSLAGNGTGTYTGTLTNGSLTLSGTSDMVISPLSNPTANYTLDTGALSREANFFPLKR